MPHADHKKTNGLIRSLLSWCMSVVLALGLSVVPCALADPENSDNSIEQPSTTEGPQEGEQIPVPDPAAPQDPSSLEGEVDPTGQPQDPNDPQAVDPNKQKAPAPAKPADKPALLDTAVLLRDLDYSPGAFDANIAKLKEETTYLKDKRAERTSLIDGQAAKKEKALSLWSDIQKAQIVVTSASDELERIEALGIRDVLSGKADPQDLEANPFLLKKILEDQNKVIESGLKDTHALGLSQVKDRYSVNAFDLGMRAHIAEANATATKLEQDCSLQLQRKKEVQEALDKIEIKNKEQEAQKAELVEVLADVDREAQSCFEALTAYYDAQNTLMCDPRVLSFGEGCDFALSEEVFVAKWGRAIDAFYEQMGSAPLKGYGEKMAKTAYAYGVDPRLCAAVSMVESSGGQQCIKPHNAWGWGAIDSDPYGHALSWDSYDEAIEAWHDGVMKQSAMAHSGCVSRLATVYCSNPHWGEQVAVYMAQISSLA